MLNPIKTAVKYTNRARQMNSALKPIVMVAHRLVTTDMQQDRMKRRILALLNVTIVAKELQQAIKQRVH